MAKLIDLMRQAGAQWPEGAEYAAQHSSGALYFYKYRHHVHHPLCRLDSDITLKTLAEDWSSAIAIRPDPHRDPGYMREQQRLAARNTERRDLVRELMLRHPELTGPQAIEQADEILETLEGMRDGR